MREHVGKVIDQARRPGSGIGFDHDRDLALRLASETVRLARLAASTHMILSARLSSGPQGGLAEPLAVRGQTK